MIERNICARDGGEILRAPRGPIQIIPARTEPQPPGEKIEQFGIEEFSGRFM